jgi:hypothetical protein
MLFNRLSVAVFITLLILPTSLCATESNSTEAPLPTGEATTLEPVTVIGQAVDPLTVSNSLNRTTLKALPAQNGSLNEVLSVLPGIQYSEAHRTSDNAGEIIPPSLSISGGRFYENNFIIDGVSNNSLLDPSSSNIDSTKDTPGHPQSSFLHPSLIESINVQRANISARYGSFTGGVVEAETRDPAEKFGGEVSLRHTRSEWTRVHRNWERRLEYWQPSDGTVQPNFRKFDGFVSVDIPINDTMGILASYSQTYSEIPLYQVSIPSLEINQTEQERVIENYFLKYVARPSQDTKWSLTWTYAPYDAEYFRDEAVNSRYTLDNSTYTLASSLERQMENISFELDVNYSKSTNSRTAPADSFNWLASPTKPWGYVTDADKLFQYSKEGGYGDLDKDQETKAIKLHVDVEPFRTESLWHKVGFGFSYEDVDGKYHRANETTQYIVAKASEDVICPAGSVDCISGEQYMWFKNVYPAEQVQANINFFDAYIEDEITVERFTIRPGVRVSRDDLQDNTNWAPRLSASYDIFGDASSLLYAGANRYYGKTLLTNALKENRSPTEIWWRFPPKLNDDMSPADWVYREPSTIAATRLSDLATPYTDELAVGFDQDLFEGTLNVTYIHRDSDDELSATVVEEIPIADGLTYKFTEWTNDGSSEHQEVSASWEREWRKHYLMLSATWQETETSNSDYDARADYPDDDLDGDSDPVWFANRLFDRSELPRPDYNRAFSGTLTYIGKLPYGFSFTNITRYRSGYTALVDSGEDRLLASGLDIPIYIEKRLPESWITDWKIDWEKKLCNDDIFVASLEVNNLFNEKVQTGVDDTIFNLGRQFWFGVTYKF